MQNSYNDAMRATTLDYLASIDKDNPPKPSVIEAEILENMERVFQTYNNSNVGRKWKVPLTLEFQQIAQIIATIYPVCRVITGGTNSDPEYDLLAIYQTTGPDEGIYVTSDDVFRNLARQYNYRITTHEYNEMITTLRDIVPRRPRCTQPHLIAVNNGIFNYETKQLQPFTQDLIFLTKSRIDYKDQVTNPIIHNDSDNTDWDVETWMSELSDDPEITNVLWQVLGAIIRPNVPWGKSAWFYSESGNNGKGTLCELMRQLCGNNSYASIPLSDMGKDFMLEPLTRASAIIVDENDVGTYIDKAANLKAIITGDVIQINRKFKTPISYQFKGFMIQCLNEMPRIKDKSDSFYRRQLFIPFTKCFTGAERKYIKQNYLHRQDVLEYVLHRVLNMNYDSLDTPKACQDALEEYKEFNDPIRQFIDEILPECVWDLLPFTFLYELYKAWFQKNIPSGTPQARNTFIKDLVIQIQTNAIWDCPDKNAKVKTANRIQDAEPLIEEYGLRNWMNPHFISSNDVNKKCIPQKLSSSYRGLTRRPQPLYTTKSLQDTQDDT